MCASRISGEEKPGDKVKTTHLGKKGFEKSCKSNSNDLQDCYVE